MEHSAFYNQIQNPLNDQDILSKLLDVYATSFGSMGGFYGKLTQTVEKEHNKGEYYRADADKFYAMLFNKWKNSIVAMTKEEFIELYKKGSYGYDFIKMRQYLKNVSDVTTMAEANNIFFGKKGDKELEDALDKYRWSSFGDVSGWVHVCSRYLTAKKDDYPNVEHRLYIDCESLDTYKIINILVEKCDKYQLPYYFKFDQYGNRDDTVVIYSSTENLNKYLNILKEMQKEYPKLISRMKDPPLLTGRIDGWIGYGSEPNKSIDGKKTSFNKKRATIIEKAIDESSKRWINFQLEEKINVDGRKVLFKDYLSSKITDELIKELEEKYQRVKTRLMNHSKNSGTAFNEENVIKEVGYTLESLQAKEKISTDISTIMNKFIIYLRKYGYEKMSSTTIDLGNGISLTAHSIEKVIHEISPEIPKYDPNFLASLKSKIEFESQISKLDIDPEKFCFDVDAVEKIDECYKVPEIDDSLLETFKISRPVANFLTKYGIDLNNLPSSFTTTMHGKNAAKTNEIDYALAYDGPFNTKEIEMVNLKDIVGTFAIGSNDMSILQCISYFYHDKDNYGKRALNNLDKDILENLKKISTLNEPIKLAEIGGKYYVTQDGNHRTFYAILAYLILKEIYKNDAKELEKIESQFMVKAEVTKKLGYDKIDKICYSLQKSGCFDIKFVPKDDSKFPMIQVNDKLYEIGSEEDFINLFKKYMSTVDKNSPMYSNIINNLQKIGVNLLGLSANLETSYNPEDYAEILDELDLEEEKNLEEEGPKLS